MGDALLRFRRNLWWRYGNEWQLTARRVALFVCGRPAPGGPDGR